MSKRISVDTSKLSKTVIDMDNNRTNLLSNVRLDKDNCSKLRGCWESEAKSNFGLFHAEFENPLYVQEYNNESAVICYGPTSVCWPNCGGGYIDGNIYTWLFYDPKAVIKLEKQEDGSFQILSNTFYDTPAFIRSLSDEED